jgi:uncharacterized protein
MDVFQPTADFKPAWFMRGAHAQSVVPTLRLTRGALAKRSKAMLSAAREHIVECSDGTRLLGYYSHSNTQTQPLVVLIHGWEGSAESHYVLSLSSALFAQGFDVFRLNLRDHGPTHHLNEGIFHSCRINEVVDAVKVIQQTFNPPSLSMAGFSLGGNFSLRVAVRAPNAGIDLKKVVAISPVLRPHRTMQALESGWVVYRQYFIRKWKSSLEIKQHFFPNAYDLSDVLALRTLSEMTDLLARRHGGFADLDAYLNGYAIIGDVLANLSVESHIILSQDDPIIPVEDIRALPRNEHLHIKLARHGGHCGFVDRLGEVSWAERTAVEILKG